MSNLMVKANTYLKKKLTQSNMERYNPANCLISDLLAENKEQQKTIDKLKAALKEISEYSCIEYGAKEQLNIAVWLAKKTLAELEDKEVKK